MSGAREKGRAGRPPRFPWRQLRVGDALTIPRADWPKSGEQSMRGTAYRWGRELGGRIRARKVAEGLRVERIA